MKQINPSFQETENVLAIFDTDWYINLILYFPHWSFIPE